MRIVYLDQNKWIELARASRGRHSARNLTDVLDFVCGARDIGQACFPLSFGHYMETQRTGDLGRRKALADFMLDLSLGTTIADVDKILRHEIDNALYRRYPDRVRPEFIESLDLLGTGMSHASGRRGPEFDRLQSTLEMLPPKMKELVERLVGQSMLSGVNAFTGESAPRWDGSGPEVNFMKHLGGLHERLPALDPDTRERALYAIATLDIVEPLGEALGRHGISWDEFLAVGAQGLCGFIDDLPTRRVDMHLHRQWLKNRSLRAKRSELHDWGQVGPMVMYCDVVVTEKLLADLINRPGLEKHATVITDLRQLPLVLVSQ